MHIPPPVYDGVSFVAPDSDAVRAFLANRTRVVAATGHRPDKFPARHTTHLTPLPASFTARQRARDPFGVYTRDGFAVLVNLASQELRAMGADAVVTGGALGWDQVVAHAALMRGLPLLIAVPFESQPLVWPDGPRRLWERQARQADVVVCVTPVLTLLTPAVGSVRNLDQDRMWRAMQDRNVFMVSCAHEVLAGWNSTPGGT